MNNQIDRFSKKNISFNKSPFEKKIDLFLENHKVKYYEKGSFVFLSGDVLKNLYLILNNGRINLEFNSGFGRNITKSILGKGDVFGELALIGVKEHKYTARVRSLTKVCMIPIAEVKKMLEESNVFTALLMNKIGQNLFEKEKQLESFVFKDSRTRVIEFLLDLGRKGTRVGYEQLVNNIMTHQEIADLTRTSRQTVTMTLSELRHQNLLTFNRKRMLIRDMDKLAAVI